MKKNILAIALLALSCTAFAQTAEVTEVPKPEKQKYTFETFFNQLDLPFEVGMGFPNGGEKPGVFFRTCIDWRQHVTWGWFAFGEYDNYDCEYSADLMDFGRLDVNAISGEERFNDLLFGTGYRVPIVRDLAAYKAHPHYENVFTFHTSISAGASFVAFRNVVIADADAHGQHYKLEKKEAVVPALRLNVGFEYHINYTLALYVNCNYVQHLKPTPIERGPMGVWAPTIGLTTFFK